MKKIVILATVMVLAFAFSGCGSNDSATESNVAANPAVATPEAAAASSASSAGSGAESAPEVAACPWQIPLGHWQGYDRFSGEQVSGLTMNVYEATSETLVFDYLTPSRAWRGVTAFLDSSGCATYDSESGVVLNISLSDSSIVVDEIEGMGAMGYDFRPVG